MNRLNNKAPALLPVASSMAAMRAALIEQEAREAKAEANWAQHGEALWRTRHPDGIRVLTSIDMTKPLRVLDLDHLLEDEAAFDEFATLILSRVTIDPVSGCWVIRGGRDHDGYAVIRYRGDRYNNVARLVCALVYGPMPQQAVTRHSLG